MASTIASCPSSPSGKKLVNTKSGLRMISLIDEERSAFEIDEPVWQNDNDHLICNKCGTKFTFKTRRHHCRRCGKIFCGSCCAKKIALPRLAFVDPQRVCTDCIERSQQELELYERHLPILLKGAHFQIDEDAERGCQCNLNTKTYRDLVFTLPKGGTGEAPESIYLKDITSLQCMTDALLKMRDGKPQVVGIKLEYFTDNRTKELKMTVPSDNINRSKSLVYLRTLQKAMKMIFESSE